MKSRNPSARVALGAPTREATARLPKSTAVRDIDGLIRQRTQHLTNKRDRKGEYPCPTNARRPEWFLHRRSFGRSEKPAFVTRGLSQDGVQTPFRHGKQIMNLRNG